MINKLMSLTIFLGFLLACSNDLSAINPENLIQEDVSLPINQTYTLYLSSGISIEGGYSINTQAKHFKTSEIVYDASNQKLQYIYTPTLNFSGNDSVLIKNCISAGGVGCNNTMYIKISFLVTN